MLTLIICVALTSQVHAESAAYFLKTMQQENGGFITVQLKPGEAAKPTLRTTRTALSSFRMLGKEIPNREAIISFHKACYDSESGGFADEPGGRPDPISTSVGLMILKELELPSQGYLERGLQFMNQHTQGVEQIRMVASSLEEFGVSVPNAPVWELQLREAMNPDGSFGDGPNTARLTGLFGVAIQRLGGQIDATATLQVLRAGQLPDGGFGRENADQSDLESCYRIVRLFHRLRATPVRVVDLREFIVNCKNSDGGYGRTPTELSSLHGTYYATIITGWLNDLEKQHLDATRRQWNFDDVRTGDLPADWTIGNTLPGDTTQWRVEASDRGNSIVQVSPSGANRQFNLLISDFRQLNVDLSVNIQARSGDIDQGGGVVWRYVDSRNYYVARWNPLEDNLRVYKVIDGVRSQMDTAKVPQRDGWRRLRIVTYGRDIRGYLDGHLYVEAEDDAIYKPGFVGLWTKADAVTEFDDLRFVAAFPEDLEELPTPSPDN